MSLTSFEFWKLLKGNLSKRVAVSLNGKSDKDLFGVEPWVTVVKRIDFEVLDWLDDLWGGILSSILARTFKALRRTAAEEPNNGDLLPQTIFLFGSSREQHGTPVISSFLRQAATTLRSAMLMPRVFISISSFVTRVS